GVGSSLRFRNRFVARHGFMHRAVVTGSVHAVAPGPLAIARLIFQRVIQLSGHDGQIGARIYDFAGHARTERFVKSWYATEQTARLDGSINFVAETHEGWIDEHRKKLTRRVGLC
ncbi:MAG: hypothetical protein RB191_11475, partial [Terriglobia bacterium]|nr:hypothetical protein [Terriglobia bacterium]